MRLKFHKEMEFFLKKIFFSQSFLLKRRLDRAIKNNEENEIKLVKKFVNIKKYINLGLKKFSIEVRSKKYPTKKYSY